MNLNYLVFHLLVIVFLKSGGRNRVTGIGDRVSLSSTISLQGIQCGGPVTITCRAYRLAGVFWWINDTPTPVARFTEPTQDLSNHLPVNLTSAETLQYGWVVLLTELYGPLNSQYNFTTTLETTTEELVRQPLSRIWCGRNLFNASLNVSLTVRDDPATPSTVQCTLSPLPDTSQLSMTLYLADFIEQNAIDKYRVTITPSEDVQGCFGDFNGERYSCTSLQVGTDYALSLQGINCGTHGGGIDNFRIFAKVPDAPTIISVQALYDKTSRLIRLDVMWTQQFTPPASSRCLYFDSVRYEVGVISTGQERYTATATAEDCNSGVCSILVNVSTSGLTGYNVSVQARNDFGPSVIAYYQTAIASMSSKLLNHSFSFSNCITYALCTSPLQVKNCTAKYGTDSSYPVSNPQTTGPLNTSFQLPLLRRLTKYYHEANISVTSSFSVVVRGEFKTGDFAIRLTPQNTILIAMGSILLALSVAPLIINIILVLIVKHLLGRIIIGIILASEVVTLAPAIIVWIVTGQIVASQANTCDEHWQGRRNTLIIAAHVLSDLALLVSIPALIASLFIKFGIKEVKSQKEEPVYRSQYDYIDKNKAEERGIYMRQNYAYSNPFRKKKKANINLNRTVGALYEDTSKAGAKQRDIELKTNYAYHPTVNSKKELDKPSKSKNSKSKKEIYSPPMKMRDDQNISKSLGSYPSTCNPDETAMNEGKPGSKEKPQNHSRKIYAPPVLNKSSDSGKFASTTTEEKAKHEYSYVSASIKCDPTKSTGGSSKPISSQPSEGIKLKENYAYTESNVHDRESGQVYTDGYVGPVVPPVQHTEGIALKNNYAYKVGGLKSKLRAKKK